MMVVIGPKGINLFVFIGFKQAVESLTGFKIFLYQWPTADIDKDHIGIPVDQLFPVDIGPCYRGYVGRIEFRSHIVGFQIIQGSIIRICRSDTLLSFIGNAADIDFGRFICTGSSGLKICNLLIDKTDQRIDLVFGMQDLADQLK